MYAREIAQSEEGVKENIVVDSDGGVRFWGDDGEQVRSAFNITLEFDTLSCRRRAT